MRRSHYPEQEVNVINWRVIKQVLPYLLEFKLRVTFALVCLILTKLASVYLPFILKDLVDTLEKGNTETLLLALLV